MDQLETATHHLYSRLGSAFFFNHGFTEPRMLCHLDTLKVAQCSRAKVEHDKIEQTQDILDFHKLDWWAAQLSDAWCRSTRCPVCEGTLPLTAGTRLPNIWEPCWRKKVSALSRARWSRQEHPYRYIIFLRDVFWKAFG